MQINTNLELASKDFDPQSWSGATYQVNNSETIAQIDFFFVTEIPFFPKLRDLSFREARKDNSERNGGGSKSLEGQRRADGLLMYDQDSMHFIECLNLKIHLQKGHLEFVNECGEAFHRSKRQSSTRYPRFDMKIPTSDSIVVILFGEALEDTLPHSLTNFVIRWKSEDVVHKCQVFEVELEAQSYEIHCKDVYISWDVFPQYEF